MDNIHVFGSEGEIEEKYKFPVLNGNLVFLCCRKSVEDIHECFGIGEYFFQFSLNLGIEYVTKTWDKDRTNGLIGDKSLMELERI